MNNRLPLDQINKTSLPPTDAPVVKRKRGQERFSDFELENIKRNFAKRLKMAFRHANNAEIARALKTTDTTIKLYTDAQTLPTFDMLLQIHFVTRVNLHWLLTGEGSMTVEKNNSFSDDEIERVLKVGRGKTFDDSVKALTMAMVEAIEKI